MLQHLRLGAATTTVAPPRGDLLRHRQRAGLQPCADDFVDLPISAVVSAPESLGDEKLAPSRRNSWLEVCLPGREKT